MTQVTERKAKRAHRYSKLSLEDRAEARREDFLRAGAHLIGTVGLEQIRIKDLCQEAGLTTRYFYESFEDLEELAVAVVRKASTEVALRVTAAMLTAPQELRLRAGMREMSRLLLEAEPGTGRILMIETTRAGGRLAAWRHRGLAVGADIMLRLIASADDHALGDAIEELVAGSHADIEAEHDPPTARNPQTVMAIGAISELIVACIEGRVRLTPRELADTITEVAETLLAMSSSPAATTTG